MIAIAQTCIPNLEKQHGQQAEPVVQQPEEVDFSENIIVAYQLKNGKNRCAPIMFQTSWLQSSWIRS